MQRYEQHSLLLVHGTLNSLQVAEEFVSNLASVVTFGRNTSCPETCPPKRAAAK